MMNESEMDVAGTVQVPIENGVQVTPFSDMTGLNDRGSADSGIDFLNDAIREMTSDSYDNEPQAEYIVDPSTCITYIKGKFLGKGGFARVHELIDLSTSKVYAGKIIPKNRIVKRQHMQKIAREILIHKSLKHEHIVGLINFFEDPSKAFMVLENCPMQSLVHVLKYRKTLTNPEVRYFLSQLTSAVKYIHSQKIIHRDLKPGNMLLTETMVMKVGDFGLAMYANTDARVMICGTPNYIAPEVLKKQSCGFESDVWAIGCIMYTLLVGKPPFETDTLKETYARIVDNQYTIPGHLLHSAHVLLRQLLHPDPECRLRLPHIPEQAYFEGYIPTTLTVQSCFSAPMFLVDVDRPVATASVRKGKRISNIIPNKIACEIPEIKSPPQSVTHGEAVMKQINFKASDVIINPGARDKSEETPPLEVIAGRVGKSVKVPDQLDIVAGNPVTFRQKLGSMFCVDACGRNKSLGNAAEMHKHLELTLKRMPTPAELRKGKDIQSWPLFVSKWIDYSNKYGFGFLLSDNSVGVLYNDTTKMSFTPDHNHVEFHDIRGKVSAHPVHSVPESLRNRYTLLNHFMRYMEENLTDGADLPFRKNIKKKCNVPFMKRWVRTSTSIIMELSNGTLQINFFKDHTKLILHPTPADFVLTYIDRDRQVVSFYLQQVAIHGCRPCIAERLRYAAAVLHEFAQLDGDAA